MISLEDAATLQKSFRVADLIEAGLSPDDAGKLAIAAIEFSKAILETKAVPVRRWGAVALVQAAVADLTDGTYSERLRHGV